jgi:hypothetical protein
VEMGFRLEVWPRAGVGGRVPGPASCEANGFARVTPTQAGILRAYGALKAGAGGLMRAPQRFSGPIHDDEAVMNGAGPVAQVPCQKIGILSNGDWRKSVGRPVFVAFARHGPAAESIPQGLKPFLCRGHNRAKPEGLAYLGAGDRCIAWGGGSPCIEPLVNRGF